MGAPYKIRVKLGSNEFEAEGPEDVVKEQVALFLEIAKAPTAAQDQSPLVPRNGNNLRDPVAISAEMLDRVYSMEQEGQVSLKILPQGKDRDADSLLLLLYGYRKLLNQAEVLSGRLLNAARMSGLQFDRIDRAIVPHIDKVTKGGVRIGSKYGLRNNGTAKAEEIIAAMLC